MQYYLKELQTLGQEPLSLAQTKSYLRLDAENEEENLSKIITASRQMAEEYLRLSLVRKRFALSINNLAHSYLRLPYGPILEVERIVLSSKKQEEMLCPENLYTLKDDRLIFHSPIIASNIEVYYQAGYVENSIPNSILQGMLMHVVSLFDARSGEVAMPKAAKALYQAYRRILL
jgi:uncharacterized phiE125 gp8 family phage protein